ncbi:solute carrier family 35 member F2 [Pseudophryne corroboree]|uniref:solute carrier family 35 member F2 n=1 Tax=Pseudophryne corroboree TaxID=495146 RepID=UPI003081753D
MDIINTHESSVHPEPSRSRISEAVLRVKEKLFNWPPGQEEELDKNLLQDITEMALKREVIIMGDFNLPDINWEVSVASSTRSKDILISLQGASLHQLFKTGENGLLYIVRHKWWKYILLAIVDVEANYSIVKAYQFTTITSVQLLDCVGIPVLMALSWFILRARFRLIHYIAVVVCLLGVGTMVGADVLSGREEGKASDMLIGDLLVILGACLYSVSNVSEEYVVKNLTREEFLGMLGLFGTFISGMQLIIVEYNAIGNIEWNWIVGLLFAVFALCMFGLYSLMPIVIRVTSATSVNLGILTADLYSLFFGLFLFGYNFSGLYILAFVVIMVGFIMYCSTATYTAEASPEPTSGGIENSMMKEEVETPHEPHMPLQYIPEELSGVLQDETQSPPRLLSSM